MDQSLRTCDVLQRNLRVLNRKAERDLQQRLCMLDKQYRYALKTHRHRTESLLRERRRVVMVKVCEPKATVNIAMREIGQQSLCRGIQTSESRRWSSSRARRPTTVEQNRSISAPVRHRGHVQSGVSLLQMKQIATIDSISEKQVEWRRRRAREELQRLRDFQRETLHQRVAAFVEKLKDRSRPP